jgi:hypothetical protein
MCSTSSALRVGEERVEHLQLVRVHVLSQSDGQGRDAVVVVVTLHAVSAARQRSISLILR